jgi:hypothetical protein
VSGCADRVRPEESIANTSVVSGSMIHRTTRMVKKVSLLSTIELHSASNMAASIPRFLLPQRSSIWRSSTISSSTIAQSIRNASHNVAPKAKAAPKIPVLEKPAKFNPPSHGAKLRKDPLRYPGPRLSSEEVKAQQTKKYPNMMPAEGTFMHWFLTDRSIHVYITLVSYQLPVASPIIC